MPQVWLAGRAAGRMMRSVKHLLALILAVGGALLAGAEVHTVSTPEALKAAVDGLQSGDEIRLAADIVPIEPLEIRYVQGVTITSVAGVNYILDGGNARTLMKIRNGADVDVSRVIFRNGLGSDQTPGALSISSDARVRLNQVTFRNNRIPGQAIEGGAVSIRGATVSMEGCDFLDNEVGDGTGGSALRVEDAAVNCTTCVFRGNTASNGYGGALYIGSTDRSGGDPLKVVIRSSAFEENRLLSGVFGGGAVTIQAGYSQVESVALLGCSFRSPAEKSL